MMQDPRQLLAAIQAKTAHLSSEQVAAMLPAPVIVLSAPRSGSTLLFEQMMKLPPLWSLGGESHAVFRLFPMLRAENGQLDSMALSETHATPQVADLMRRSFLFFMRDHRGGPLQQLPPAAWPKEVLFLEKTPRNALNIPFLLELFPDARFIYLHRGPRQTISSLIEAWSLGMQSGRFVTFRDLPGWHLPGWCFLLPKGWRSFIGKGIPEIAAFQWAAANQAILDGLQPLEAQRVASLSYDEFLKDPSKAIARLDTKLGLDLDVSALRAGQMPVSRTTVSQPSSEKWRRHEALIEPLLPALQPLEKSILDFHR